MQYICTTCYICLRVLRKFPLQRRELKVQKTQIKMNCFTFISEQSLDGCKPVKNLMNGGFSTLLKGCRSPTMYRVQVCLLVLYKMFDLGGETFQLLARHLYLCYMTASCTSPVAHLVEHEHHALMPSPYCTSLGLIPGQALCSPLSPPFPVCLLLSLSRKAKKS